MLINLRSWSTRLLIAATIGVAAFAIHGCSVAPAPIPTDAQPGVHTLGTPGYSNTTIGTVLASVTTARGMVDNLLVSHKISVADAKSASELCDGVRLQLEVIKANPPAPGQTDARLLQAATAISALVAQLAAKEAQ